MSHRNRLDRLEMRYDGSSPRFTIWDVIAGGADPDDLDPDARAILDEMLAGVPDGPVPDPIEREIAEVCNERPAEENQGGASVGTGTA